MFESYVSWKPVLKRQKISETANQAPLPAHYTLVTREWGRRHKREERKRESMRSMSFVLVSRLRKFRQNTATLNGFCTSNAHVSVVVSISVSMGVYYQILSNKNKNFGFFWSWDRQLQCGFCSALSLFVLLNLRLKIHNLWAFSFSCGQQINSFQKCMCIQKHNKRYCLLSLRIRIGSLGFGCSAYLSRS